MVLTNRWRFIYRCFRELFGVHVTSSRPFGAEKINDIVSVNGCSLLLRRLYMQDFIALTEVRPILRVPCIDGIVACEMPAMASLRWTNSSNSPVKRSARTSYPTSLRFVNCSSSGNVGLLFRNCIWLEVPWGHGLVAFTARDHGIEVTAWAFFAKW